MLLEYKLFLDTNALLNLQGAVFKENFIISQKTLEEIENIKSSGLKDNEIKYKARKIAHLLDEYYGSYIVKKYDSDVKNVLQLLTLDETPDNIILATAYIVNKETPVLVCTDDLNCRFIAREIFGLKTKGSYDLDLIKNVDEYKGYKEVTLSDSEMSDFYLHQNDNKFNCIRNEYLIVRKSDGEIVDTLCWTGDSFRKVCIKTIKSTMFGDKIRPKDIYQSCAIDSILNNTMTIISGKAGTGKSLISLITIMHLIESGKYDRVVIMFNPTKARGAADMGYYAGDALSKALQNNVGEMFTSKFGDRLAVDLLIQQGRLKLVSMADIRGFEVTDREVLMVSELQNSTIDLLRLCLSRASSQCKIVLEGDYKSQVDSYIFEGSSNGMKRAIDVFQGEEEFGYVHLPNVWRSRIAELCEKL